MPDSGHHVNTPYVSLRQEWLDAQIAAGERNPSLVRHEFQTKRSPDRVFKVFLQEQKIGRAKPVVLIASKSQRAVDVLSSQRLPCFSAVAE